MYKYLKALTLQWFILAVFFSSVISTFIFTYLLAGITQNYPLESTITITVIGAIFVFALFYEWYHANPHTFWGKKFHEILNTSYERNKYLKPKAVMKKVLTLIALTVFLIGCGVSAWTYPSLTMFFNWGIGIAGASLGTYMFKEEFHAPAKYKQRIIFWISLSILSLIIAVIWFLSINGIQYDDKNKYFGLLLISVGAWLAFGILGSIVVGFCNECWSKLLNIFT